MASLVRRVNWLLLKELILKVQEPISTPTTTLPFCIDQVTLKYSIHLSQVYHILSYQGITTPFTSFINLPSFNSILPYSFIYE